MGIFLEPAKDIYTTEFLADLGLHTTNMVI